MKKIIALTFVIAATVFMWSCGAVDNLETFSFQYTVNFEDERINESVPDSSVDRTDLNDYAEYRDNKDKIVKSEILHFNFWIDSMAYEKYGTIKNFDPKYNKDEKSLIFDYVKFFITFDNDEFFELATFENVNVLDYYRNPFHINEINTETRKEVLEKLKNNPIFYTKSVFGKLNIEDTDIADKYKTINIPYFKYKTDIVLRFEVDL